MTQKRKHSNTKPSKRPSKVRNPDRQNGKAWKKGLPPAKRKNS